MKKLTDYEGTVDAASFERGSKVWFRELTVITPLTMADVISPGFIEVARKAYPA